jgi:hypothetical protein
MANKDYKKEGKTRLAEIIRPDRATRLAASSLQRGDLDIFSKACKELASNGSMTSRKESGKFWRDNTDPALLASRSLSSRRWLAMPVAWSQAPSSEKPWLLPRMVFCAAKAISQSAWRSDTDPDHEPMEMEQLLSFTKKALADIDGGMNEATLAEWTQRGLKHGSPLSSWCLIEALRGHLSVDFQQALASRVLAKSLAQGVNLHACKKLARLAGGVANAEKILERLSRASRGELMPHEPDYALAQRVGGDPEHPERHGSLIHATLDRWDKFWNNSPKELSKLMLTIKWLSQEGARLDRLSLHPSARNSESLLCPLGRACLMSAPFDLVDTLLAAGADATGSEGCSMLPLSALCSKDAGMRDLFSSHVAEQTLSQLDTFDALVRHGAPINGLGIHGETAIHLTAGQGRFDLFERLASAGADLSIKDFSGLHWRDWTTQSLNASSTTLSKTFFAEFFAKAEALELEALTPISPDYRTTHSLRI